MNGEVECQRTGYENTQQHKPDQEIRTKGHRNENSCKINQNTNDARSAERAPKTTEEKHTRSRGTDKVPHERETTRKRGEHRHKDGERGDRKRREKQGQKQKRRNKREGRKMYNLKAVIVTWVPASATKLIRGPCHTLCRLFPTLVNSGVKCQCCRCRAPSPH